MFLILESAERVSSYYLAMETGANGSIVYDKELLHRIRTKPLLTFSGKDGVFHL